LINLTVPQVLRGRQLDLVGQEIEGNAGRFGNLADARPAFFGGRLHHFPDIATRVAPAVEFLDRHIPIGPQCHERLPCLERSRTMWSMTGPVGQQKVPSAGERLQSDREEARRDTFCPAGGWQKASPSDVTNLLRDGLPSA
jgi:hypothetical protein